MCLTEHNGAELIPAKIRQRREGAQQRRKYRQYERSRTKADLGHDRPAVRARPALEKP
jgi:hypothetical protein